MALTYVFSLYHPGSIKNPLLDQLKEGECSKIPGNLFWVNIPNGNLLIGTLGIFKKYNFQLELDTLLKNIIQNHLEINILS